MKVFLVARLRVQQSWQMEPVAAALMNLTNRKILERLPILGLPEASLVAGCVWQPYLNLKITRPAADQISDYDIFYFDPTDLSYEAEDRIIRQAKFLFQDIDAVIEIRNQARVHLWYPQRFGVPCQPITSVTEAVSRFPVRGACLGITGGVDGHIAPIAPYGWGDLLDGILRANPACPDPLAFKRKALGYQQRWPSLRIIE